MHVIKLPDGREVQLKSEDSHVVLNGPIAGITTRIVIKGNYFVTAEALKKYPELRVEGCQHCKDLMAVKPLNIAPAEGV